MFTTLMGVVWNFLMLYLYCEMGESVEQQFDVFHEELRRLDWYLFPIEIQSMLVIMLSSSQQSKCIQGFANIACTRDAF